MSAEDKSLGPPRGMRDFYPEDMTVRNAIFDAWTSAALLFGFSQYDACVVETLDILKRKSGEEITEQIYAFLDKSGRELALRPEMTPTLARMVAAKQASLSFPLKWFAIAQCFRYERMTKGRKREHYQWNLDIIGENSVSAEAEVVACAVHSLSALGIGGNDVKIHFSSRALLAELLQKLGIPESQHALTFLALDKRGKIGDDETQKLLSDGGMDAQGIDRVFGLLKISSFAEVCDVVGVESVARGSVEEFTRLLSSHGIGNMAEFDISVVRGLSYYTGIVFEAFDANRKFRAIFGGGRYDNLLNDIGGAPATAVGLGFGDVVVAELLAELNKTPSSGKASCMAVSFMTGEQRDTATSIATALRTTGRSVDLALRAEKPKNFFSRAGRLQYQEAIYIGPDDIAKGTVRIKNMSTRQETETPIAKLIGREALPSQPVSSARQP